MNRKAKVALGIVIIAGAMIYWIMQGVSGNEVYYLTVSELGAKQAMLTNQRVKMGGIVKAGSINQITPLKAEFQIAQDDKSVPVYYEGTLPDMFKDDSEVIVEGTYDGTRIIADNLIAKCASKYETEFMHEDSTLRVKETEN